MVSLHQLLKCSWLFFTCTCFLPFLCLTLISIAANQSTVSTVEANSVHTISSPLSLNLQYFLKKNTFQLYSSSRPTLTVIDRCLQSNSAKSDMRHMGVPPSCHVHPPMSLLWLRWRWQEQSGACQSNRKRITRSLPPSLSRRHTDSFSLSLTGTTHIH